MLDGKGRERVRDSMRGRVRERGVRDCFTSRIPLINHPV